MMKAIAKKEDCSAVITIRKLIVPKIDAIINDHVLFFLVNIDLINLKSKRSNVPCLFCLPKYYFLPKLNPTKAIKKFD